MAGILTLLVTGCADPELGRLKETLGELQNQAASSATPSATEAAKPAPIAYRHADRPSPFQALPDQHDEAAAELTDAPLPLLGPLEQFPLEALRLVGTLQREHRGLALVATPEDQVVTVRAGDAIGQSQVEIVAISREAITFKERVFSEQQGWQEQLGELTLDVSRF